eukprot:SAG11_NODE_4620_length_1832_cov_1.500866_4_plen_200_part_00
MQPHHLWQVVESMAVNMGVMALATLGLLIFGIVGVSLLAGQMFSCNCSHGYPVGVTPQSAAFDRAGGWVDLESQQGNDLLNASVTPIRNKQDCLGLPTDWQPSFHGVLGMSDTRVEELQGLRYGIDPNFPESVSKCFWDNRPYNFDTVANAMMALFSVSTLAVCVFFVLPPRLCSSCVCFRSVHVCLEALCMNEINAWI